MRMLKKNCIRVSMAAASLCLCSTGVSAAALNAPMTAIAGAVGPHPARAHSSAYFSSEQPDQLRYVALGDSVPYGHGLANPETETRSGLPPNQGPSKFAWPSLVDTELPGLAPLRLRPTGCSLTGPNNTYYDQLAYSGAPTEPNTWTGKDTNCHYPAGVTVPLHKAVVPNEVNAANLKADPPALVTIQAGADDLGFSHCMMALLGAPSQVGAERCYYSNKSGLHLTPKATTELQDVTTGLTTAINEIKIAAPDAQIVLVNYYQPIPSPTEAVYGSGAICRDIRAHSHIHGWRQAASATADYVQGQLNDAIAAAATASTSSGVQLVDIAHLFEGHEMCTSNSWVFSDAQSWIRTDAWRAAHPTKAGQAQIADAVVGKCMSLANHCLGRKGQTGQSWSATEAPMPTDADPASGNGVRISSVTCPSSLGCDATGFYPGPGGGANGWLLTDSSGSWATAGLPNMFLWDEACPSAQMCIAVGSRGLWTGWGSAWTGGEPPLPSNAESPYFNTLTSIACPSSSQCTVAGDYADESNAHQGLLLTGSGTSWTTTETPLPTNAAADPNVYLRSVTCPTVSHCTALGSYTDSAGYTEDLLLSGSGTSWTVTEAPVPTNAAANSGVTLDSLACPSVSYCVAVGFYTTLSGGIQGLMLTGSGTSWTASNPPLPADAAADSQGGLQYISCPSANSCVAAGTYYNSFGSMAGLLLTMQGSSWTASTAPMPPQGAVASLGPVTCVSSSECLVVGTFGDSSGHYRGLLLFDSRGVWTPVQAPVPANSSSAYSNYIGFSSLACQSDMSCIAVGSYQDNSGYWQGLILSGPIES
jgi:hypothetical protein